MDDEFIEKEFVDHFPVPGLEAAYKIRIERGTKIKTSDIKLQGLETLHQKPLEEIGAYLASVADFKAGVLGFKWTCKSNVITLIYVDGKTQTEEMNAAEKLDLTDIFTTLLKSRRNIMKFEWDFRSGAIITSERLS
jgi:hypothetical protein